MAEDFTFEITGLDEVQAKLESLKEKVALKGVRNALKAGALVVLNACVALAPHATGFLAEHFNIKISVRQDALAGSAFIGPNAKAVYPRKLIGPQKKDERTFTRTAEMIARWLEFGTSKMAKKPFMTQALESTTAAATDAMVSSLRATIEE